MAKQQKKLKDPNAPKRPLSSYMLYSQERRAKDESLKEVKITEQTKVISAKWNTMTEDEKKPYVDLAKIKKKEYEKVIEEYKKTDEYKSFQEQLAEAESNKKKKSTPKQNMTGQKLFVKEFKDNLTDDEKKEFKSATEINKHALEKFKELDSDEKKSYERRARGEDSSE